MLVLSRRMGEQISIGDNIIVTVVRISPIDVRIGIEAPKEMSIARHELLRSQQTSATDTPAKSGHRSHSPDQKLR